jgi:adenine-specific DNA methylase
MITTEKLKEITGVNTKQTVEEAIEEMANNKLINLEQRLIDAAKEGKNELHIGNAPKMDGLLRRALERADVKINEMGLKTNMYAYKDAEENWCMGLRIWW